jgi:hypothetical protein
MLLRLQAGCCRSLFAEMQEFSQLKAELRQALHKRDWIDQGWFASHVHIV